MAAALPVPARQRDAAYDQLRRLLVLQQLPPGSKLREPEWAERLGVNRVALREAFARLEAEGWITRAATAGYAVPELTHEDVREILDVRCLLECGAVDRIVARGRRVSLAGMKESVEQLRGLVADGYWLAITEADRRFHEGLIALSGNQRLILLYARSPLPMIHQELIGTEHWPARCRQLLEEHEKILGAIEAGDAESAKRLLQEHLDERYLLPVRGKG